MATRRASVVLGVSAVLFSYLISVTAWSHPHGPGTPAPPEITFDSAHPFVVVVALPSDVHPGQEAYIADLLATALEKTGVDFEVDTTRFPTSEIDDIAHALSANHHRQNVTVAPPHHHGRSDITPIYFPVYRGAMGTRVVLTTPKRSSALSGVTNLADLRGYTAGVSADTEDAAVFSHNRIDALTFESDNDLLSALLDGTIEYAAVRPTTALRLLADAEGGRPELIIEGTPALAHYGDSIIYVDASDQRLISALDYGLMRAMEEGDLHTLFESDPFLSGVISDTRLSERNYIRLSHPDLPNSLARVPPDLWLWPHGAFR